MANFLTAGVSKRLQQALLAALCLAAAQAILALASCEPDEVAPMAARAGHPVR